VADQKFETPAFRELREIPDICEGAMDHSQPFIAKAAHNEPLGFPGELGDNWEEKAVAKLGDLLEKNQGASRLS